MPAPRIRSTETGLKMLEARRQAFDKAAETLAHRLRAGDISLEQWRTDMRQEIKDLHITSLVVSRGGEWKTVSFSEWGGGWVGICGYSINT
jgi:hypothetical protein